MQLTRSCRICVTTHAKQWQRVKSFYPTSTSWIPASILLIPQPLVRGMPKLPVTRPGTVFDLGNKPRMDEDRVPLSARIHGELADGQLIHLRPKLGGGMLVEAGPHSADIDELPSLASGKQKPTDAAER